MSSKTSKIAQKVAANSTFGSLSNAAPKSGWTDWFKRLYEDDPTKVMPYKAAHAELIKRKKNRPSADHKLVKVNAGQFYVKTTFKPLIFSDTLIDQTRRDNTWIIDYVGLLQDKKSIYDQAEMIRLYDAIRPTGTPIYQNLKSRVNSSDQYTIDMELDYGQFGKESDEEHQHSSEKPESLGEHVAESQKGSL